MAVTTYEPRLKTLYRDTLVDELQKQFELDNRHEVPRLQKIVVSVGIGKHKDDKHFHEVVVTTLRKITGQQPVDRVAKKSIATFKIRKGMNRIGVSVTLRGNRMYEFLDRFINVAMPRIRDFHGASLKGFDRSGNYNFGVIEQSIFPELTFEDTQTLHGLQITFVMTAANRKHTQPLLEKFGIPFEKTGGKQ